MSNRRSLRLAGETDAIADDFDRAEEVVLAASPEIAEAWDTLRNKRKEVLKSYLLWGFHEVIGDPRVTRVAEVYLWIGLKNRMKQLEPEGRWIARKHVKELRGFDADTIHRIEIKTLDAISESVLEQEYIEFVGELDRDYGPEIDALMPAPTADIEDDPEEALEGAYEDNPLFDDEDEAESPGPVPEAVPAPTPTPESTPRPRSDGPPKPLALRITEYGPAASPIMRMPRRKQSTSLY